MKKLIVGVVLSVMSLGVSAQSTQFWKPKGGKVGVCAAYGYGKFSGPNGKRPKYLPIKYRKAIRSRNRFMRQR
jgi:hypothetical protein